MASDIDICRQFLDEIMSIYDKTITIFRQKRRLETTTRNYLDKKTSDNDIWWLFLHNMTSYNDKYWLFLDEMTTTDDVLQPMLIFRRNYVHRRQTTTIFSKNNV